MKNLFNTRLAGLLMAGLLVLATLNSCMKDDDYEEVPVGVVTMVNGYVSSNGVIYAVDNNTIQYSYNPLPYQKYDAFRIFPGNRRLRIFTETEEQLVDETYNFEENTYYTSFIYGLQEDARHLLTKDQLLENLGSESGMRFFHLSPSAGQVNVYLDNKETLLFGERTYENGDGEEVEDDENIQFVAQSSGKHTIIITDEADETLVEREYTFKEGWHYSIILIGDDSTDVRKLYLGIVEQYQS
ncbi:DUF4397 domain-containing protein [Sphingobacterium sp. SGG-5]|uniref:DUF4397 domain-containing protein n=1 Tax=Sphingobacterium sp. SGG-5 TaxID=2710881 RepID=UPI0013EA10A4|nr:DUF4397 domain-containing protein [Sphingobacterium sp. SGG-5]NGM61782.1 DUF4397 domain-containing protein [Sphingobacterium sp. SGG-5]